VGAFGMPETGLGPEARRRALERMRRERFDLVVVGGGVTGCGIALDAATRGLSVALVEQDDFAAGTSSRSGKLIHGGLRYMEHLQFDLVRESLRERKLLLERICPHLVKPMRFLYLLEHRGWERAYLGSGLALYDVIGGAGAVPRHRHLGRRATQRLAPALRADASRGAISFYDTQCDDARHTVAVARTAAAYGAVLATGVRAVGFGMTRGRVHSVDVREDTGDAFAVEAAQVISAGGAWTEELQGLLGGEARLRVRASKGVHLVVPRERIRADAGFVLRAEREPQIFVRPWNDGRYWMFGTTDTAWDLEIDAPTASGADVAYLLRNVNRVLDRPLGPEDVVGAFAGLRPLVAGESDETSRLSREHLVTSPAPGILAIAGGKYTTYRVMAADAVDAAAAQLDREVPASCTDRVPLLGAEGYPALWNQRERIGREHGLSPARVEHLLNRHGSLAGEVLRLIRERPDLREPVEGAPGYLRAEALYAASHEGARDLEAVLSRRTHISIETRDRGLEAAPAVAALVGDALGWDAATRDAELDRYRRLAEGELAARAQPDDRSAVAVRRAASAAVEPPVPALRREE
jgi:glycerol-3-phosphate dehydrogenase